MEGLTIGLVSSVLGVLVSGVMTGVLAVAWRNTGFSWIGTFVRGEYSAVLVHHNHFFPFCLFIPYSMVRS